MTRRVYIAGPITGMPGHNYPAFRAAATRLRQCGHTPVDPTVPGHIDGWQWEQYMRRGLRALLTCDGVALLPGWENSRGAQLERQVAEALGMDVRPLAAWLDEEAAA